MSYIRRLVWHIASRLLILFILCGILAVSFFMCLDIANIYTIATDGMEKRVDVILTREGAEELSKFYTPEFISADPAMIATFDGTSVYNYYTISSYSYSIDIEKLWVWPWDDYATITVVERVRDISGKVLPGHSNDVPGGKPEYAGGRYSVTMKKENGRWRIAGMQQTERILEAAK